MISHLCAVCAWPVEVDRVDVTASADPVPRYMWGRWEACTACGSTLKPTEIRGANDPGVTE